MVRRGMTSVFLCFLTLKLFAVERMDNYEDNPLINQTIDGKNCVDYLKKGGSFTRKKQKKAGALALALGAGSTLGAILTAPTIIGPFFFTIYGGGAAGTSAAIAYDNKEGREESIKLGQLIEESYQYHKSGLVSKQSYLIGGTKFLKNKYPATFLSKDDIAYTVIRANEAGWFCRAKIFDKKEKYNVPVRVGYLEKKWLSTILNVLFPSGNVNGPTTKDIEEFQKRKMSSESDLSK